MMFGVLRRPGRLRKLRAIPLAIIGTLVLAGCATNMYGAGTLYPGYSYYYNPLNVLTNHQQAAFSFPISAVRAANHRRGLVG
jgi:hypothetical protein